MPEYIEREAVIKRLEASPLIKNCSIFRGVQNLIDGIIDLIKRQPTADVVEVRHSEWKQVTFSDGTKSCKCCMACGTFVEPKYNYKYCPECGAKMDGKGGCDEG